MTGNYQTKSKPVQAEQWKRKSTKKILSLTNDKYVLDLVCNKCKKTLREHGITQVDRKFEFVCPNHWLVEDFNKKEIISEDKFERMFDKQIDNKQKDNYYQCPKCGRPTWPNNGKCGFCSNKYGKEED